MEVHHHPKLGKKDLKELFLEGLMIFFAVTMGFFSEQFREHMVEKSREKEIVEHLIKDLEKDQKTVHGVWDWYKNELIPAGDTLQTLLNNPNSTKNDNSLYVNFRRAIRYQSFGVFVNNFTYSQMIANNGLSLIEDLETIEKINSYYLNINKTMGLEEYLFHEKQDIRQKLTLILDGNSYDKVIDEKDHIKYPSESLKVKNYSEDVKNDLLIRISDINGVSLNIVNRIAKTEKEGLELSKYLKEKYDL
ncbi:hypothetical protein EOJ36_10900 [Sandaracinomonas limnophila]|uniref:Uncharacterized protein n=1 Tax=Sandaracinomonas limnophila TaxID=1862386 RepID=A0A437PMT8_9BACT|nr:hypothetical protein [Sandaracinomonas limnophila]RVU23577.1 hypothetical protein EOJ36_10900 [Sandaracinomonas limnophila]